MTGPLWIWDPRVWVSFASIQYSRLLGRHYRPNRAAERYRKCRGKITLRYLNFWDFSFHSVFYISTHVLSLISLCNIYWINYNYFIQTIYGKKLENMVSLNTADVTNIKKHSLFSFLNNNCFRCFPLLGLGAEWFRKLWHGMRKGNMKNDMWVHLHCSLIINTTEFLLRVPFFLSLSLSSFPIHLLHGTYGSWWNYYYCCNYLSSFVIWVSRLLCQDNRRICFTFPGSQHCISNQ
jgi:hypothetical protein